MSHIDTYLNKRQVARFRLIARKLGLNEYHLLRCLVLEFLRDPAFVIWQIENKHIET